MTPAQRRKELDSLTPPEFTPPQNPAVTETLGEKMDRGTFLPTGWIPPENLSRDGWLRTGEALVTLENFTPWGWGDWWCARKHKFTLPEDWRGPNTHTLENYAIVCRRFGIHSRSRRREAVSFKHHAEVAALLYSQREALLDWCEQTKASVPELRAEKRRRVTALSPPEEPPPKLRPKVPPAKVTLPASHQEEPPPAPPAAVLDGEVLPPPPRSLMEETRRLSERDFLAQLCATGDAALDDPASNSRAELQAVLDAVHVRMRELENQ